MLGFPVPQDNEPPKKIGRYTVLDSLGKGSCGVVYRAFDPFVRRYVAIKVYRKNYVNLEEENEDLALKNFLSEAHTAGQLLHPNIVALYDVGLQGDQNYIVMEYVSGHDLNYYAKGGKKLPIAKCIDVIFKCCDALDYAHRKGVIHRDIKPGNILLDDEGVAKLTDFNIANTDHTATMIEDGLIGSPAYMPPEIIEGKAISPQSDIYSLGVALFQLLSGQLPFKGETTHSVLYQILNQEPPSLLAMRPGLPARIEDIVMKCLEKDPANRYQSCKQLASDLTYCFTDLRFNKDQIADLEKRNMLKTIGHFSIFEDSELDELLQISSWLSFLPGDKVVEEGEIDSAFFVVAKGDAVVSINDKTVGQLGTGDCFGEVGVLNAGRRTATVVARSFMLVMKLNSTMVDQLSMPCQLHFYKMFLAILVQRLSGTNKEKLTRQ